MRKLWVSSGDLVAKTEEMIKYTSEPKVDLTSKRSAVIVLYQIVSKTHDEQIKEKYLGLQRVFMRFLFDRRGFMQDLASKALSLIYNNGDETIRKKLVESLSAAFAGEGSSKTAGSEGLKNEYQAEGQDKQEMLLEFKDNTSTEQADKLKTYKDLVQVADSLGKRELIYQFLEVHRHLTHYQDIKNAAKGLSNILMLDEKLKADLVQIAPRILLLTYDYNQEVSDTMKELWSSLIDVDKENELIKERWSEIYSEAYKALQNTTQYR